MNREYPANTAEGWCETQALICAKLSQDQINAVLHACGYPTAHITAWTSDSLHAYYMEVARRNAQPPLTP
jgi:hypothetical protein